MLTAMALVLAACTNGETTNDYNENNYNDNGISTDNEFNFNDNDFNFDLDGPGGFGPGPGLDLTDGDPDPALLALVDELYEGVEGVPMTLNSELTAENFEGFVFIDYIPGTVGVVSMAAINVHPHAVVLMQLPAGTDTSAVAAEIQANADPSQWICVTAEDAQVFYSGYYVLFVMSWQNVVDGVVSNADSVLGNA